MTPQDVQNHMEDIKEELKLLLFHEQTLLRKLELVRPKIESKIAIPKKTTDIRNLTRDDLNIDVVPANLADMETIKAREDFYYASIDIASIRVAIAAKKELYESYKAHLKQDIQEQARECTNEMIYNAYSRAQSIIDLNDSENEILKNIGANMMKILNSGKVKRLELYDTLQNLIKQHS